MAKTLFELAEFVGGYVVGDGHYLVEGVATLIGAGEKDISFLSNRLYKKDLISTSAGAVILSEAHMASCQTNALVVADPYVSYAKVAALLCPPQTFNPYIDPTAVVAVSATVDDSVYIGANCVIGEAVFIGSGSVIGPGCVIDKDCRIGNNTRLVANVTLCSGTTLGDRCLIHPGVVVGSDGFGLANDKGNWIKVPQLGKVRIGHDVEIGANTTVDRGALDDTVIDDGVKLDNLIQVAHNVRIGAHTVIAGCSGIAGSAEIGKHCALGGGVGVVGHLQIADGVQITGMSMVTKSIKEPGVYSSGVLLQANNDWHRNAIRFKQLDELAKRLKEVELMVLKQSNEE